LLAAVQTGAKSKKSVTRKQFRELQLNAMGETAKAAGKNDLQTSLRVSRNTEARLKQRLGISFVKPQQTTKARAKAGPICATISPWLRCTRLSPLVFPFT